MIPPQFTLEEWIAKIEETDAEELPSLGMEPIDKIIVNPGQVVFVKVFDEKPEPREANLWRSHILRKLLPGLEKEIQRAIEYQGLEDKILSSSRKPVSALKDINTIYKETLELCRKIPLS